ncbi:MAG: hypothetical protein ABF484_04295 [Bifidobacterium sp.]|uniref:hypothetical protein n=2 Tax=Bifidobacterium sp. TaxID=41200 RepID=UPI0039EB9903
MGTNSSDSAPMAQGTSAMPDVPVPRHHARMTLKNRVYSIAGLALIAAVFAGAFYWFNTYPLGSLPRQTLTTGVAPDGTRWRLSSSMTETSICLEVDTADDPKHPDAYDGLYGGGACSFDNTRLVFDQYSFLMGAINKHTDEFMIFAPAPANAVRVQVAEHQSVPTHAIPGFFYKGVRYWYFAYPKNWPNSASGEECDSLFDSQHPAKGHCKIQAYDKNGEVVPFGNHYLDPNSEL